MKIKIFKKMTILKLLLIYLFSVNATIPLKDISYNSLNGSSKESLI